MRLRGSGGNQPSADPTEMPFVTIGSLILQILFSRDDFFYQQCSSGRVFYERHCRKLTVRMVGTLYRVDFQCICSLQPSA